MPIVPVAIRSKEVNPLASELLQKSRNPTADLRSKSWDEFVIPHAPRMYFVFTVCDQAAREPSPYWPGQPVMVHWGVPDPALVVGNEEQQRHAYRDALMVLNRRIELFISVPLGKLNKLTRQKRLKDIGKQ